MKKFIIPLLFLARGWNFPVTAQDFNYTNISGTAAYTALTNPVSLNNNQDWSNREYKIAIGFPFTLAGKSYDSLTVRPNGFINFDKGKRVSLIVFTGFLCMKDSAGTASSLGYQLSGSAGNRILKIEYRNCGYPLTPGKLSYQVWLFENLGDVEIHVGPNDFSSLRDSAITSMVGIINPYMNLQDNSFLLYGNPDNPLTQVMHEADKTMKGLIRIPAPNKVFRIRKS